MSTTNDNILTLPESIEIERVIDGNEVKTFQVPGTTLLILDDKGIGNYTDAEVLFENPVKVVNGDGKVIGAATLYAVDGVVEADLFLDYHTPERLNIETKSIPMFAHITALEAMDNTSGRWVVHSTNIITIQILSDPNPDARIEAL